MRLPRLAFLVALIGINVAAHGQGFDPSTAVAIPSTLMHGAGVEHVDLMSGALVINIPLLHLKGRGLDTDIVASYSSKVWGTQYIPEGANGAGAPEMLIENFGLTSQMQNGWSVGFPRMIASQSGSVACPPVGTDDPCLSGSILLSQITRNDGSTNSLTNSVSNNPNGPVWSYDGSYLKQNTSGTIFEKNGNRLQIGPTTSVYEDTNGNKISCSVSTSPAQYVCLDTLGRSIVTSITPNPGMPSFFLSNSLTYPDENGTSQTITFTYANRTIRYAWATGWDLCGSGTPASVYSCLLPQGGGPLLTSITLPNGSAYTFEYADNGDGTTSGELSKLTLPTGGYIRYVYTNLEPAHSDLIASNRRIQKRYISPDGTSGSEQLWDYGTNGAGPITDPQSNVHSTTFSFIPGGTNPMDGASYPPVQSIPVILQTKETDSLGNVLEVEDLVSTFDSSTYAVDAPFANLNNPRVTQVTTTMAGSSQQSVKTSTYSSYGNLSEENQYGWAAAGSLGNLLRTVTRTYLTDTNSAYTADSVHILDRVTSESVIGNCGAASGTCSVTSNTYDGYSSGRLGLGLQATSSVIGHDYAVFSSSNQLRGNVTQTVKGPGLNGGSTTADMAYNDLGGVRIVEDGLGHQTTIDFTDNYFGPQPAASTMAFPTTITKPTTGSISHVERLQYYLNSGLVGASCGENFPAGTTCAVGLSAPQPDYASLTYDLLNRAKTLVLGDGGGFTLAYTDTPLASAVSQTKKVTSSISITNKAFYDGLGRKKQTEFVSDPISPVFVDSTYDSLGRLYSVTNPYRLPTGPTYFTYTRYDGLGRPVVRTQPDGTNVLNCYNGVTVTASPANCVAAGSALANTTWMDTTDEAGRTIRRATDALGQLVQILEPNTSGVPSIETDYAYDVLSNLKSVTQHGVTGETARTRNFTYDSLSRLITSNNPETKLICYGQWSGSNCINGYDANSNLLHKTDARNITINYVYDNLNRLSNKTSTGEPSGSYFAYDTASLNFSPAPADPSRNVHVSPANPIGRMTAVSVYTPSDHSKDSTYGFSYDLMGRLADEWIATPSYNIGTSPMFHASAVYDLAGSIASLVYPDGRNIFNTFDTSGRLTSVTGGTPSSPGDPYMYAITYNPDGTPLVETLGNNLLTQTTVENPRLQVQSAITARVGGSTYSSHTYCYDSSCAAGATANNGNLWKITDLMNGNKNQTFGYDALNRISSFTIGPTLSQQYTIDSFGNMSLLSGGVPVSTFDYATNRINNLPCASSLTPFDDAGNQRCDTDTYGGVRQYDYDSESRIAQISTLGSSTPFETYAYDFSGTRIRKTKSDGSYTEYINFGGMALAEKDQADQWTDYIYANGKKIAKVQPQVNAYRFFGNHVGWHMPFGVGTDVQNFSATSTAIGALRTGDVLSYDSRSANTGMSVYGGLYIGIDGTITDLTSSSTTSSSDFHYADTSWQRLAFDLSGQAGHSLTGIGFAMQNQTDWCNWELDFANLVLTRADGTVIPILTTNQLTTATYLGTLSDGSNQDAGGSEYLNGATEFVAAGDIAEATSYYVGDHLGTTQMEFTAAGRPVWKGEFTPFGQELSAPTTAMHYKFTGKERDSESGNDYFGARYYGSNVGRFMSADWASSADPIPYAHLSDPQSLNLYSYVGNNPLGRVDPDGHLYWNSSGQWYGALPHNGLEGHADGTISYEPSSDFTPGAFSSASSEAYSQYLSDLGETLQQIRERTDYWQNKYALFGKKMGASGLADEEIFYTLRLANGEPLPANVTFYVSEVITPQLSDVPWGDKYTTTDPLRNQFDDTIGNGLVPSDKPTIVHQYFVMSEQKGLRPAHHVRVPINYKGKLYYSQTITINPNRSVDVVLDPTQP